MFRAFRGEPPSRGDSEAAGSAARRLRSALRRHPSGDVELRLVADGEPVSVVVPRDCVLMLIRALSATAAGHLLSAAPLPTEVSEPDAANLLGISVPALRELLDAQVITRAGPSLVDTAALLDYANARDPHSQLDIAWLLEQGNLR